MILLCVMLVAYILAINFYAFLLVKSFRDDERRAEMEANSPIVLAPSTKNEQTHPSQNKKTNDRTIGKLCITGALGGAITIYVCMFILKYKRADLLLMVLMPLLGVLNIYLFILLFRHGLGFFLIR